MKKKWLALILAFALIAAVLVGCDNSTTTSDSPPPSTSASTETSQAPSASESQQPSSSQPPESSAPPEVSTNPPASDKNSIVIGGSRPVSGVYAVFEQTGFGPVFRMWVDEVNAAGGIYVAEYGKQLPIETIIYDDGSDMDQMMSNLERLILTDKVDLLIPPCSTATLFAAAPLVADYGMLLLGAEGGASTLKEYTARYPTFFAPINCSDTQVPALVEVLVEKGVKSAYVVFIEDLFGTEYSGALIPALTYAGIEVRSIKSVAPDVSDMTAIISDAKATGAEAFLLLAYPDQNFGAVAAAMALGYNPDVFLLGPGGCFDFFQYLFPSDGVMSFGAWNPKSSPAAAEYLDKYMAYISSTPSESEASIDWWGHLPYYMSLQALQQAIERAGTLDNHAIAQVLATEKFDTCMGEVWFYNNFLATECFEGNVGQWQNGVFEVIDVNPNNRTADPIVPKPQWPAE